jgi:hypothetical protein
MHDSNTTTSTRHKKGQEGFMATEVSTMEKEPTTSSPTATAAMSPLSSKQQHDNASTVPPLKKRFGRLGFRDRSKSSTPTTTTTSTPTAASASSLPVAGGKRRLSLLRRSISTPAGVGTPSSSCINGSSASGHTASKEFRDSPDDFTAEMNAIHVVPLVVQQTKIVMVEGVNAGNDDTVNADVNAPATYGEDNENMDIDEEKNIAESDSMEVTTMPGSYLELICGNDNSRNLYNCTGRSSPTNDSDKINADINNQRRRRDNIPDDPTVQESIECVFASQLGKRLPHILLLEDDEGEEKKDADNEHGNLKTSKQQQPQPELMAPSRLQQSLLKNRSEARLKGRNSTTTTKSSVSRHSRSLPLPPSTSSRHHHLQQSLPSPPDKKKIPQRLVHVGTYQYDPSTVYEESTPFSLQQAEQTQQTDRHTTIGNHSQAVSGDCPCRHQVAPVVDSSRWPQRPLLLRPTPDQGTRVHGIRFSSDADSYSDRNDCDKDQEKEHFLWNAGGNPNRNLRWPGELKRRHFGKEESSNGGGGDSSSNINHASGGTSTDDHQHAQHHTANDDDDNTNPMEVMCPKCMVLPINNGNEPNGKSLVTDFETDLFQGSLLVRIRNSEGTCEEAYDDNKGYFKGMNRRYQVVIRGKFKKAIPLTECMSGFQLARPCGKLPPKFIFKGALKVISFFAPQLQVKWDGKDPSCLTPFGSTPQTIIVQEDGETLDIEALHEEPVKAKHAVLGEASGVSSSSALQRARLRKKAFDKLFTQKSKTPLADTNKVYTFEFLQHLFNFHDFTIELGSLMGSVKFQDILEGQPLQIMAMHGNQKLWCFDIWHECLLADAKRYDEPKAAAV